MIRADVLLNPAYLGRVAQRVQAHPRRVLRVMAETMERQYSPPLLSQLASTPGPVKYPFEFATERSRRAFFATDGFGRGIPTRRTGALGRGYRSVVTISGDSVICVIGNVTPYRKYVKGPRQVPGHRRTGWDTDEPILRSSVSRVRALLTAALKAEFG